MANDRKEKGQVEQRVAFVFQLDEAIEWIWDSQQFEKWLGPCQCLGDSWAALKLARINEHVWTYQPQQQAFLLLWMVITSFSHTQENKDFHIHWFFYIIYNLLSLAHLKLHSLRTWNLI